MELTVFLLKNVAHRSSPPCLRMVFRSRVFCLFFFLALVVFPCAPETVKRQNALLLPHGDGGEDITLNDGTQGGQQQDLTKSDNVDEQGADEKTNGNDPLSGRSEHTNTYSLAPPQPGEIARAIVSCMMLLYSTYEFNLKKIIHRYVLNEMCWLDILLHLQREFLFIYPYSKSNDTDSNNNETLFSTTVKPTTPALPSPKPILPVQTGVKAQEEEQSSGLTIFFSLLVIGL